MSDDGISVPYNGDLKALGDLLSGVRRPGDFFVQGSLETPMPRVEVEGVGMISFPVPESQMRQIIDTATRAPYGRGEENLVDEFVRKTWQLPADQVRLGGKSWPKLFSQLLTTVVGGLGCEEANVSAELYKMLVYEPGGFFKSHRDTEKVGGMFGTLVIVLPSEHSGGELVIRHAGREVVVELSSAEFSELKFAAFYADCEHEVRPVTKGYRVCLVFNLVQQQGEKAEQPLTAPLYQSEIAAVAAMLEEAFSATDGPAKLAWLLGHQYSPGGLSFDGLKGEDAALAKVLRQAAERGGCAAHLGIVHIEEYGPAEPDYDSHAYRGSRWRQYDEDGTEDDDASSDDFEVIEVSDGSRYIDQWVDAQDQPVAFGQLPLEDGEVLPAGALDDEEPDAQRLTEATGNEGASFERSYHRAVLVIWSRERFAGVLLQAGVAAALPHLAERLEADDPAASAIAEQIIGAWADPPTVWSYHHLADEPSRAEMLRLLKGLGNHKLLEHFIKAVVTRDYDGSENEELASCVPTLGAKQASQILTVLARENMPVFHGACVNLVSRLLRQLGEKLNSEWRHSLRDVAAVIVELLPELKPSVDPYASGDWQRRRKAKPVDGAMVADCLECLRVLDMGPMRMKAGAAIVRNATVFDPGTIVVPALRLLQEREREGFVSDAAAERLWVHTAESLLARSEQPPAPPTDWRQTVMISCKCEDCRGLQKFANDSDLQVTRFRVRKDRRQHLHQQIEHHGLDMTHVTERKGSPQTLVCTKTRRSYQRQCEQHRADCAGMTVLLSVMQSVSKELSGLAARLAAAKELRP